MEIVSKRQPLKSSLATRPAPAAGFYVGDVVRLRGKPDKPRQVIKVTRHPFRYEFIYIVATSYRSRAGVYEYCPYWFGPQLVLENEWQVQHHEPQS